MSLDCEIKSEHPDEIPTQMQGNLSNSTERPEASQDSNQEPSSSETTVLTTAPPVIWHLCNENNLSLLNTWWLLRYLSGTLWLETNDLHYWNFQESLIGLRSWVKDHQSWTWLKDTLRFALPQEVNIWFDPALHWLEINGRQNFATKTLAYV